MLVILDLPESKLRELSSSELGEFRSAAAKELALALYRDGHISSGRAMALTGLTRRELWETGRDRGWRMTGEPDPAGAW